VQVWAGLVVGAPAGAVVMAIPAGIVALCHRSEQSLLEGQQRTAGLIPNWLTVSAIATLPPQPTQRNPDSDRGQHRGKHELR
jgi:hypothetical protein